MPPIVDVARKLRRAMSYPEVVLWQRLRRSPMSIRFRRQHPIGLDYVADFYCASARLVIEIDGQGHATAGATRYDAQRNAFMESRGPRGLRVIRIAARDVLRNADETAAAIVALASTPLHHPATPGGPPPRQAGEDQE